MDKPARYVLGLAYQSGKDEKIAKGLDGARDYFTAAELEKACWSFGQSPMDVGIFHADGTLGHVQVVENYIYRGPDWLVGDTVIKSGDWLMGGICDEAAWDLVERGLVTGWSPQGTARRRHTLRSAA